MEILGIGPGEFMLIMVLLLVVVGPERLPDLARQSGRLLVRVRNWVQHSPDAAMVMRARQEIEQELASLRTSLLEVQSVRDEMLGVAKQVEESFESLASAAKFDLDEIGSLAPTNKPTPAKTLPDASAELPTPAAEPPASSNGIGPADALEVAEPANPLQAAVDRAISSHGAPAAPAEPPAAEPPPTALAVPAASATLAAIDVRLQAIMSDLFALQQQLKQRGALDDGWEPPSWGMQLPAAEPPAEPEAQKNAIE